MSLVALLALVKASLCHVLEPAAQLAVDRVIPNGVGPPSLEVGPIGRPPNGVVERGGRGGIASLSLVPPLSGPPGSMPITLTKSEFQPPIRLLISVATCFGLKTRQAYTSALSSVFMKTMFSNICFPLAFSLFVCASLSLMR